MSLLHTPFPSVRNALTNLFGDLTASLRVEMRKYARDVDAGSLGLLHNLPTAGVTATYEIRNLQPTELIFPAFVILQFMDGGRMRLGDTRDDTYETLAVSDFDPEDFSDWMSDECLSQILWLAHVHANRAPRKENSPNRGPAV